MLIFREVDAEILTQMALELHTELQDGRRFVLQPGMSYQVADDTAPHRSATEVGATLFVVDGGVRARREHTNQAVASSRGRHTPTSPHRVSSVPIGLLTLQGCRKHNGGAMAPARAHFHASPQCPEPFPDAEEAKAGWTVRR